jgi:hypothetical protein
MPLTASEAVISDQRLRANSELLNAPAKKQCKGIADLAVKTTEPRQILDVAFDRRMDRAKLCPAGELQWQILPPGWLS